MVEKKPIVHALRLNYNGPLSLEELYSEIEDWISENGYHKEIKRKSELLQKKGKKIEWMIEAWRAFSDSGKELLHIQVLLTDFVVRKIKRNGKNLTIQYADVYIEINGYLEESMTGRWTQAPMYHFLRDMFDKYVWPILDAHDGHVYAACYDLHKQLKSFFEVYKMRVS